MHTEDKKTITEIHSKESIFCQPVLVEQTNDSLVMDRAQCDGNTEKQFATKRGTMSSEGMDG